MTLIWILLGLLVVAVLAEAAARRHYRRRFLVPFHSKAIGEYPFSEFTQLVGPPLHFRFKPGFRSPTLNINRFGLRGPEPAPQGEKRRLLLIGESNFFGARLPNESDLWSIRLQQRLSARGRSDWEIVNGGFPGYNVDQYHAWWEEHLDRIAPQIVIAGIGGNDLSQAFVMGERWIPGAPWPQKVIMALQRKSPWWNKVGAHFALYFLWRRRAMTERKGFSGGPGTPDWSACREHTREAYRDLYGACTRRGIRVAWITLAPAYTLAPSPEDRRRLSAIQSNWEENLSGAGRKMVELSQALTDGSLGVPAAPVIDIMTPVWNHPKRCEMFHDVFHWNGAGHRVIAEIIDREVDALGWWD